MNQSKTYLQYKYIDHTIGRYCHAISLVLLIVHFSGIRLGQTSKRHMSAQKGKK